MRPAIPRIMFLSIPPLTIFFMVFCIWSNCFSSRLTSGSGTPAPLAMRRLRELSIISGRRRSRGVIESMIPIWRLSVLGFTAPAAAAAFACI